MVKQQVEVLSIKLDRIATSNPGCARIRQIPGIGPVVGHTHCCGDRGTAFRKGRDPVVWLGVVARQYSTGSKAKRLDNSKRGSQKSRTHDGCEDRHQVDTAAWVAQRRLPYLAPITKMIRQCGHVGPRLAPFDLLVKYVSLAETCESAGFAAGSSAFSTTKVNETGPRDTYLNGSMDSCN
jgi:hypothetical protein